MKCCPEPHRSRERGAALVISLLMMVLLLAMGAALLAMSHTESQVAANDQWAERSFQAAEAAVQVALDQLAVGATGQVVPLTTLNGDIQYRSGGRADGAAQPPSYVSSTAEAGYSVAATTGYNTVGYTFQIFRINGTGTGPRNTEREVEVEVELGPVEE